MTTAHLPLEGRGAEKTVKKEEQETRVGHLQYHPLPLVARPLATAAENEPEPACEHGVAWDVHCCGCHLGFLFDSRKCVCF